jgi:hypothetical protein
MCLGYSSVVRWDGLDFPVKIDFEGQGGSVEHRPAVGAVTQMTLDIASYFGCEPTFEILTD